MSDEKIPTFEEMRDRYVVLRTAKDSRIGRLVVDVAAEWTATIERKILAVYGGTDPYSSITAYSRNLQHRNLGYDEGDIINRSAVAVADDFSKRGFQARVIHLTSDVGVRVSWDPNGD